MSECLGMLLLAVMVAAIFLLLNSLRRLPVELEKALALVIESGCDVVYKDFHLYRDKAGKYIVLTFKKEGKDQIPMEESFDDINDAISKFAFRTKL